MGELEKQEGIDISGGRSVVARSQRGHPIYGFDGSREDRPVFGFHPEKDHAICGSPKRKGKGVCLAQGRKGNGRCETHGGKSLRGPASPNFRHGEHSIYTPPPSLLADYDRLAEHRELVQHQTSIKLIDAVINDTLSEYDSGGGRDAWKSVGSARHKFQVARRSGDRVKLSESVAELEIAIEGGVGRQSRRDEIRNLLETHRKLVDSETKRYLIEAQTYSVEQMTAYMQAIGALAGRYVPEELKERFMEEFIDYVGSRLPRDAQEGTEEIEDAEVVGEESGGSGESSLEGVGSG